jgi:hypothetical protein
MQRNRPCGTVVMGKVRRAQRVTALVAPEVVTPLAALLERRAGHPTRRSRVRAAAVRALRFLVMVLALATLVTVAVVGYEMVR